MSDSDKTAAELAATSELGSSGVCAMCGAFVKGHECPQCQSDV